MAKRKNVKELMAEHNPLKLTPVIPVDIYSQPPEPVHEPPQSTPSPDTPTDVTRSTNTVQDTKSLAMFTTYLPKHIVKQLKLRTATEGRRTYAIVRDALEQYFERNPM